MRDGWVETTLGAVADRTIGRTPPRNAARYWSVDAGDRPFLTIADMQSRSVDGGREGVTELAERDGVAKRVPAGSLLLSFKLTLGRVGITSRDVFPNEAIAWLRPRNGILRDYLTIALEGVDWTVLGGRAVKGKTLNKQSLDAVPLVVPPLAEQRRIVDLITALDDTIAVSLDRSLDEAYAAMLREINGQYTAVSTVDVLAGAFAGGTPSRKRTDFFGGDIPWLKSGEVENDRILTSEEFITSAGLAGSSAKMVPAGSTVVAMYGQGDTKGRAGYVASPVTTNQAVLALQPDSTMVHDRYLLHAMRSRTESLRKRAVGAAQPNLSKALVLSEPIPLPPLDEQVRIAALLDSILETQRLARHATNSLRSLRSNLLTALLSGEHEIPESYDALIEEVA